MAENRQQSVTRAGLLYGLAAYGWWGLVPLYFKQIAHLPPAEVLAQRIVWSLLFLVVLLGLQGTAALAEPANHPARSDAVRVADRGQRPAARPQRPSMLHGDYTRHTEVQRTSNGQTSHSTVTGANGSPRFAAAMACPSATRAGRP